MFFTGKTDQQGRVVLYGRTENCWANSSGRREPTDHRRKDWPLVGSIRLLSEDVVRQLGKLRPP